ncbi:hypothetical protein HH297_14900, partial [Xanthomonas sp. Kuri4-3]
MSGPDAISLRTVLSAYPHTDALRSGALGSTTVRLDLQEVSPVHRAFAPMVREQAYDLCELALVTALQAIAYGRPVVLLPAVVAARFQRGCLIAYRPRGVLRPSDLPGMRVGVRAYTQTTGMWVRAHLAEDFGLDIARSHWITHDPPHVEQYRDPPFVLRVPGAKGTLDMLRDGDIDAAILGNDLPRGEEFVAVVPDAQERDLAWWRVHRFMPINHMVVAGAAACHDHPGAVRDAYALLREADRRAWPDTAGPDAPKPTLFGFQRLAGPLAWAIDACVKQG